MFLRFLFAIISLKIAQSFSIGGRYLYSKVKQHNSMQMNSEAIEILETSRFLNFEIAKKIRSLYQTPIYVYGLQSYSTYRMYILNEQYHKYPILFFILMMLR